MNNSEKRTVETSTIQMVIPDDYEVLDRHFKVFRYAIPRYQKFDHTHVVLHENISSPYRYWHRDPDGPHVYMLWPTNQEEEPVALLYDDDHINPQTMSFQDIPFHMIIKLLAEDHFRGRGDTFTGQGKYYRFVKRTGRNKNFATCVEFDIRASKDIGTDDKNQSFDIYAGARQLALVDYGRIRPGQRQYYVETRARDGAFSLQLVRRDNLFHCVEENKPIWEFTKYSNTRTRLEFINVKQIETSRGYVLNEFCHRFVDRLNELGIPAHVKQREFTKYHVIRPAEADINFTGQAFYLVDARHVNDVSLEEYATLLGEWYPEAHFMLIAESAISETTDGPVILITDAERDAYDELLNELEDPYQRIYEQHPDIPLQTFNINQNVAENYESNEGDTYLAYTMWAKELFDDYRLRSEMVLRDAVLKHAVLRQVNLQAYADIPAPEEYLFFYNGRYKGTSYQVFLEFQDGQPMIQPLIADDDWNKLNGRCSDRGIDWRTVEETLKIYQSESSGYEKNDFLIVVGTGAVSLISDIPEYALPDFEEVKRRIDERNTIHSLEHFKLLPLYNAYAAPRQGWPSNEEIEKYGLDSAKVNLTKSQKKALGLRKKLIEHDKFIDQYALRKPRISWNELVRETDENDVQNEYLNMLSAKELKLTTVSSIRRANDELLNPRGKDILFYNGVWFDASDGVYMVGAPDNKGMNEKVHNAHRLRCFEPVIGEGVSLTAMLDLMAVGFVRLEQYTVVPYPFKLMRLYIENYLYWMTLNDHVVDDGI